MLNDHNKALNLIFPDGETIDENDKQKILDNLKTNKIDLGTNGDYYYSGVYNGLTIEQHYNANNKLVYTSYKVTK